MGEDRLALVQQILWAWQWALAEQTHPDLVNRQEQAAPARRKSDRPMERAPWDIRKLDERTKEVRAD